MGIRAAWENSLKREGHVRDPAQETVVEHLEALEARLVSSEASRPRWFGWLRGGEPEHVRGMYLWGGVGRGKTFLMDLFYESLEVKSKRRIHFHRIMRDVHERLAVLGDIEDPLDRVAADLAAESRVLCFDEFFVSDIGDAMILGRLLRGLFDRGVTLVTTSNAKPDDLYKDGLQRSRFLPAIALLNDYTDVIHMGGDTDFRLRLLEQAGTWLDSDDADSERRLEHLFDESASSDIASDLPLEVNGRVILARKCAKSIAWFDFDELCDGPRSQADYIEIARWYPTVIVSGVPVLNARLEDQARRFIALVDEFYDRRVKLIVSAAADATTLYQGTKLDFEYQRTSSRLVEMQSREYLHQPHLA